MRTANVQPCVASKAARLEHFVIFCHVLNNFLDEFHGESDALISGAYLPLCLRKGCWGKLWDNNV